MPRVRPGRVRSWLAPAAFSVDGALVPIVGPCALNDVIAQMIKARATNTPAIIATGVPIGVATRGGGVMRGVATRSLSVNLSVIVILLVALDHRTRGLGEGSQQDRGHHCRRGFRLPFAQLREGRSLISRPAGPWESRTGKTRRGSLMVIAGAYDPIQPDPKLGRVDLDRRVPEWR